MTQPGFPLGIQRAFGFGRQCFGWMPFFDLFQRLQQLLFEPRMQDHIGSREHALGAHQARLGTEKGQQFGCAAAHIFMRLQRGLALQVPVLAWLGNGLIRPCLVLIPQFQSGSFRLNVGLLDQSFFSGAAGSCTVTTPALRLRKAVPVGHQVRVLPKP